MKFSKTLPTEDGLYWAYLEYRDRPEVVQLEFASSGMDPLVWTIASEMDSSPGDVLLWGEKLSIPAVETTPEVQT